MSQVSRARVADDLRHITEQLSLAGADTDEGLLGGTYGYGASYSGSVFEMRPFYWGDCVCEYEAEFNALDDALEHADTCYQAEILRRGFIPFGDERDMILEEFLAHNDAITGAVCAEMGLNPNVGSYVHCTCGRDAQIAAWTASHHHAPACPVDKPNFLHRASGVRIEWYKYIGRSMEVSSVTRREWDAIVRDCLAEIAETGAAAALA